MKYEIRAQKGPSMIGLRPQPTEGVLKYVTQLLQRDGSDFSSLSIEFVDGLKVTVTPCAK